MPSRPRPTGRSSSRPWRQRSADPRRFDRLTPADIGERAQWSEDYAKKMIEFGRTLLGNLSDPGY